MADTATLRIVVDASGAIVPTQRIGQELESLGTKATISHRKVESFAHGSAYALSTLASSGEANLTTLLRSTANLGFAFGTAAGGIVLAGTAIIDMFLRVGEEAEKSGEKVQRSFDGFARSALQAGQAGAMAYATGLGEEIRKLHGGEAVAGTTVERFFGRLTGKEQVPKELLDRYDAALKRVTEYNDALRDLTVTERKHAEELAQANGLKEYERAFAEFAADAAKHIMEIRRLNAEVDRVFSASDFKNAMTADLHQAYEVQKDDLRETIRLVGLLVDKELESLNAAKQAAAVKRQFLLGTGLGLLGSLGPAGSAVSGAIGAGITGFGAAGVFGAAFGAVSSLVGSIIGIGHASKEAAAALHAFITQQRLIAGDVTQEQLVAQETASRYADALANLAREQRRYQTLLAQGTITLGQYNFLSADNQRRTDELISLQQRAGAATSAQAEALRAEAVERERIAAIDTAIRAHEQLSGAYGQAAGTLQSYRNQLLLSNTQSPTDRLAEARRQYQELVGQAGSDNWMTATNAAQQLPAAAQALLDASRAVNASGEAFQSDMETVLADNQDLIDHFSDLQSIEELQLEELRAIRNQGVELNDVMHGPIGLIPTMEDVAEATRASGRTIVERLDRVADRVDAVERATRNVGNAIITTRALT